eukprot:6206211-Pleurochrysis_carterae.AAC.8
MGRTCVRWPHGLKQLSKGDRHRLSAGDEVRLLAVDEGALQRTTLGATYAGLLKVVASWIVPDDLDLQLEAILTRRRKTANAHADAAQMGARPQAASVARKAVTANEGGNRPLGTSAQAGLHAEEQLHTPSAAHHGDDALTRTCEEAGAGRGPAGGQRAGADAHQASSVRTRLNGEYASGNGIEHSGGETRGSTAERPHHQSPVHASKAELHAHLAQLHASPCLANDAAAVATKVPMPASFHDTTAAAAHARRSDAAVRQPSHTSVAAQRPRINLREQLQHAFAEAASLVLNAWNGLGTHAWPRWSWTRTASI